MSKLLQISNLFLFLCVAFLTYSCVSTSHNDELLQKLRQTLSNKDRYIAIKEQNIKNIKHLLTLENLTHGQQYAINKRLFDEYKKYYADSAIVYILNNRDIAKTTNNPDWLAETSIQLSWLYSTTGLYIEASELLRSIDRHQLTGTLLSDYFEVYSTFCSRYGQSNHNVDYYRQSESYRDSLLASLDRQSLRFRVEYAAKQTFSSASPSTEKILLDLLEETKDTPESGYIAWLIGFLYQQQGNTELCKQYFVIAAIIDIENSIRDNASFQSLALFFYGQGDITAANQFIHLAVEDALRCNVRYRISEASTYYPFINAIYQAQNKQQMTRMFASLSVISLLVIILIIILFIFYKQNKKLSFLSRELSEVNQKLKELNQQLTTTNNSLQESNLVKEEYITHFFDICSAYVDKLESYLRIINKHAKQDRIAEMLKILDYTLIKKELFELYRTFDSIFLNLYPSFVEDFNAVRPENEKIVLHHGELMNTELRIFALIRLGISDSVKIASFLRYSLSAIYNYRVRARKYCNVDKKTFEELVMKMGLNTPKKLEKIT